jgi:hypothetical protein
MITLFFALTGFTSIFFNNQMEHHLAFFIPAILIVFYGMIVGFSQTNCQNEVLVKKRVDTISFMGFLYTLMSLGILFYKLKVLGGAVPDSLALVIALTYLAIAITTSMAGLIFRGFIWSVFKKSLPEEKSIWKDARIA